MTGAAPSTRQRTTTMLQQRTLKKSIKTTGVGLHTGTRVDLTLRPAPPDSGIVFHRVDLPHAVAIPAHASHVGDTRLYLIRDGQITRVTRDHSYVERLVESGMISAEEAEHHPQRNILTAALGTNPDLIMDSPGRPEPLRPEDVLLICSDGLWGQVRDPEIRDAVEKGTTEKACRELIKLARERGGPDNITVEILRLR